MPTVNREFTFQEMRRHNMPFWKILSGKDCLSTCIDSVHDVDAQIEDLNQQLNELGMGTAFVDVVISTVTDKELGAGNPKGKTKKHTIQLHKKVVADSTEKNMVVSGYSHDNVSALMEVERAKHELEIEKLKFAKNQELESMKSEIAKLREEFMEMDDDDDESINGIESIIKEVKPYLPYLMAQMGFVPKPTAMAENVNKIVVEGDETQIETVQDNQDDEIKKISQACKRLLKIDTNAGTNLLKLAEFAELNTDGYFGIIPMLEMQLQVLKSK